MIRVNHNKKVKYSIRSQMIAVFFGMMTLALVLCLVLNNFFLKEMYYRKKEDVFVERYKTLTGYFDDSDPDGLETSLALMRYEDNISVYIHYVVPLTRYLALQDAGGNFVSAAEKSEMEKRLTEIYSGSNVEYQDVKVLEESDAYTLQRASSSLSGMSYMELYGQIGSSLWLLMRTPLAPVSESANTANRFLLFSMLFSMLIAGILISLFTRGITRPILRLADLSRRMAGLDFNSRYEGCQKNEIAVLGNSMNQMADQLKDTIDQLREANTQLKKDIEEKIQIDELRKEFLSNVSHELKTPIALIQGYAEGLQEAVNDDPESRDFYCEVIIDEAAKMNQMVKKLLTLNHLEFGQDKLEEEAFCLSELLDNVLASNELIASGKNVTLERDYPEDCIAYADEFKIEEVCTNYISNALNHVEGAMRIRVSVKEDGEDYRVTVFNTGSLIPEDSLDKVWIKFYKVDKARTRAYGGSGIGLSIVKAIMDAHGKPYGVYNTEDGVAFWFCVKKA